MANGTVLTQCKSKRRHQEFLTFLRHIEANVPEHLDMHLICGNCGTQRHARAKSSLAQRSRFPICCRNAGRGHKHWTYVIADPVIADAIRKRLQHTERTLSNTGESYRVVNA